LRPGFHNLGILLCHQIYQNADRVVVARQRMFSRQVAINLIREQLSRLTTFSSLPLLVDAAVTTPVARLMYPVLMPVISA